MSWYGAGAGKGGCGVGAKEDACSLGAGVGGCSLGAWVGGCGVGAVVGGCGVIECSYEGENVALLRGNCCRKTTRGSPSKGNHRGTCSRGGAAAVSRCDVTVS